jgi:hypothetical protein
LSAGARRPFRRNRHGAYQVALGPEERAMLRALPEQLRQAWLTDPAHEDFRRLSPPAYAHDQESQEEYRQLVGPQLEESRAEALETLSKTSDATELSEEEMNCWARALNDVRLWLGTMLDVSEDTDEDELDDPAHLLYQILTYLQGSVIEALMEAK